MNWKPTILSKATKPVNVWDFDPAEILNSPRKVKGKFHTPMIDRDKEYIEGKAVRNAVPDFMHLPILHDFHKERTVGIVTRVVELSDGTFDFEGLIKATEDCNDIWNLITQGKYDQVSIYGKRTCGSEACKVNPGRRIEPCVTTAVRIDSISVCDDNARNVGTSLEVRKGSKVVFTANDAIIKAETTDSSLMHEVTDYPKRVFGSDGLPRVKKKCTASCPQYERPDVASCEGPTRKGVDMDEVTTERIPLKKQPEPKPVANTGVRQAEEGYQPKKSDDEEPGMPLDEETDEFDEGIEAKLQKLEQIVEELINKDKAPATEDKASYELPPEAEAEYGAPEPDEGREQEMEVNPQPDAGDDDIDHMAAKIHLRKKVGEEKAALVSEEKAIPFDKFASGEKKVPRITDKTSPEEVEHWKQMYEQGKKPYAERESNMASKEAFVSQDRPTAPADSATVDAKAKSPKEVEDDARLARERQEDAARRKRVTSQESTTSAVPNPDPARPAPMLAEIENRRKQKAEHRKQMSRQPGANERNRAPRPKEAPEKKPWMNQPHSSEESTPREESDARSAEAQKPSPRPEKISGEYPPKKEPAKPNPLPVRDTSAQPISEPTHTSPSWKELGGEQGRREMENRKVSNDVPPPKGPAADRYNIPEREQRRMTEGKFTRAPPKDTTPAVPANQTKPTKPQHEPVPGKEAMSIKPIVPEARKDVPVKAGADIEARIDRLAELIAQLVQSDEQVHSQMTEKCDVCKGTEDMKDEEVDLLVKAKVDAAIEALDKAHKEQIDELKKANAELLSRIEKSENELVQKSGVAVILREGDETLGTVIKSNAAAISDAHKAKAKV